MARAKKPVKKVPNYGIKTTDEANTMVYKLCSVIEGLEARIEALEGKSNGRQSKTTK